MVYSNNAAAAAASNAVQGLVSALQDITQELHSAQGQLQYCKVEADAWKTRFEQERARNVRLRRVLRAHGSPRPMAAALSAQPSLVVSPRAGRGPSGTGDSLHLWHTLSATTAPAAVDGAGSSSSTSTAAAGDASLPPTQHLRPLKCVAEEACSPAAGQQLSTLVQPGSAHTPLAWLSASSTEGTPLSAVAAAAAAAGACSLHDPFRSVQQRSLVTVSDSGAPACSLQQQQHEQQNGDANCSGSTTRSDSRLATASPAEAPAAGGGTAPAAEAADAPLPTVASFRRSHTLPVTSSFTFARSPRFAGGSSGSFLTPAGTWLPPSGSRHTVDQLLRVMMAFTLMQGAGSSDGTDDAPGGAGQSDEDALPSVSLDDDDGSSGVGLAAAAAVSAAMARAWASAASNEQRAVAAAAAAATGSNGSSKLGSKEGGGSSSGRAGFRLVATVTNKMGKRPASTTALSSYASQDSLDANTLDLTSLAHASHNASKDSSRPGSSGSLSRLISPSPIASAAAAAAAAAAGGVSGVGNTSSGSGLPPPSPGSQTALAAPAAAAAGSPAPAGAAARSATAVPAVGGAPNTGQATTISLQWLSRPRTVLVMRKLAPATESAFLRALDWLRRHRVTMFVEPKVFQELVDSGRVVPVPESQQLSGSSAAAGAGAGAGASGSSSLALPSSSSGSLCGMLVSTAQHALSAAPGALLPSISWPGPSLSSSGGGAGGSSNAPADKAAAGGMPPASPPCAAAAGGASAATANIKTWQPELHITQQQQEAAAEGGDCGCQVSVSDLIPDAVAQQLDLVVVLGGDGTVLWTCHIFGNRSVPPLVPFNLGSLGFLTPFDPARLEQVLLRAFRGGFPITLRHRLHCTIVRCSGGAAAAAPPAPPPQQPGGDDSSLPCVSRSCVGHCVYGEEHVSLNEVVIERGISPFLTNLECFCDGTFFTHVQGDGLIVGTPTGSTAYSLAAGGSMVHPQVPCILFTPICPHSLSFRPLMFPDYVQLCVQVPADARGHVWASFDGKDRTELGPGDAVVIRLSKWPIPSVATEADPSSDWFNAVRECLHWNLRKVQGGVGM